MTSEHWAPASSSRSAKGNLDRYCADHACREEASTLSCRCSFARVEMADALWQQLHFPGSDNPGGENLLMFSRRGGSEKKRSNFELKISLTSAPPASPHSLHAAAACTATRSCAECMQISCHGLALNQHLEMLWLQSPKHHSS